MKKLSITDLAKRQNHLTKTSLIKVYGGCDTTTSKEKEEKSSSPQRVGYDLTTATAL